MPRQSFDREIAQVEGHDGGEFAGGVGHGVTEAETELWPLVSLTTYFNQWLAARDQLQRHCQLAPEQLSHVRH